MTKYTIYDLLNSRIAIRCTSPAQGRRLGSFTGGRGWEEFDFLSYPEFYVRLDVKGFTKHNNYYKDHGYNIIEFDQVIFPVDKTKNIVGYKVPFDLFNAEIKTDTLYVKNINSPTYHPDHPIHDTSHRLPSEIVEMWEPVYDEIYEEGELVVVVQDYSHGGNSYNHGKVTRFRYYLDRDDNRYNEGYRYILDGNLCVVKIRKATKEENDKAQSSVTIKGHTASINLENRTVTFGCQTFNVSELETYKTLLKRDIKAKITVDEVEITLTIIDKLLYKFT